MNNLQKERRLPRYTSSVLEIVEDDDNLSTSAHDFLRSITLESVRSFSYDSDDDADDGDDDDEDDQPLPRPNSDKSRSRKHYKVEKTRGKSQLESNHNEGGIAMDDANRSSDFGRYNRDRNHHRHHHNHTHANDNDDSEDSASSSTSGSLVVTSNGIGVANNNKNTTAATTPGSTLEKRVRVMRFQPGRRDDHQQQQQQHHRHHQQRNHHSQRHNDHRRNFDMQKTNSLSKIEFGNKGRNGYKNNNNSKTSSPRQEDDGPRKRKQSDDKPPKDMIESSSTVQPSSARSRKRGSSKVRGEDEVRTRQQEHEGSHINNNAFMENMTKRSKSDDTDDDNIKNNKEYSNEKRGGNSPDAIGDHKTSKVIEKGFGKNKDKTGKMKVISMSAADKSGNDDSHENQAKGDTMDKSDHRVEDENRENPNGPFDNMIEQHDYIHHESLQSGPRCFKRKKKKKKDKGPKKRGRKIDFMEDSDDDDDDDDGGNMTETSNNMPSFLTGPARGHSESNQSQFFDSKQDMRGFGDVVASSSVHNSVFQGGSESFIVQDHDTTTFTPMFSPTRQTPSIVKRRPLSVSVHNPTDTKSSVPLRSALKKQRQARSYSYIYDFSSPIAVDKASTPNGYQMDSPTKKPSRAFKKANGKMRKASAKHSPSRASNGRRHSFTSLTSQASSENHENTLSPKPSLKQQMNSLSCSMYPNLSISTAENKALELQMDSSSRRRHSVSPSVSDEVPDNGSKQTVGSTELAPTASPNHASGNATTNTMSSYSPSKSIGIDQPRTLSTSFSSEPSLHSSKLRSTKKKDKNASTTKQKNSDLWMSLRRDITTPVKDDKNQTKLTGGISSSRSKGRPNRSHSAPRQEDLSPQSSPLHHNEPSSSARTNKLPFKMPPSGKKRNSITKSPDLTSENLEAEKAITLLSTLKKERDNAILNSMQNNNVPSEPSKKSSGGRGQTPLAKDSSSYYRQEIAAASRGKKSPSSTRASFKKDRNISSVSPSARQSGDRSKIENMSRMDIKAELLVSPSSSRQSVGQLLDVADKQKGLQSSDSLQAHKVKTIKHGDKSNPMECSSTLSSKPNDKSKPVERRISKSSSSRRVPRSIFVDTSISLPSQVRATESLSSNDDDGDNDQIGDLNLDNQVLLKIRMDRIKNKIVETRLKAEQETNYLLQETKARKDCWNHNLKMWKRKNVNDPYSVLHSVRQERIREMKEESEDLQDMMATLEVNLSHEVAIMTNLVQESLTLQRKIARVRQSIADYEMGIAIRTRQLEGLKRNFLMLFEKLQLAE